MGVDHPGLPMSVQDLVRMIKRIAKQTLQNASIGRAGIRVYDGGWIRIEDGGLAVTGKETVSGQLVVTGRLEGDGVMDWTGNVYFRGPTGVQGNFGVSGPAAISGTLTVTGTTLLNGDVTLNSDLTLGSGRIQAGPLTIDRAGSYGGRIYSSSILVLDAGNAVLINADTDIRGILLTDGLDVNGPKNFRMEHPSKPGYWLRHGSTESPVSGIEYWGEVTLDADGAALVELPDYFEALAKPNGRWVSVTGRGFTADWTDIDEGQFTVTGQPGGRASWLVKAERYGGDFLLEEEIPQENNDGEVA